MHARLQIVGVRCSCAGGCLECTYVHACFRALTLMGQCTWTLHMRSQALRLGREIKRSSGSDQDKTTSHLRLRLEVREGSMPSMQTLLDLEAQLGALRGWPSRMAQEDRDWRICRLQTESIAPDTVRVSSTKTLQCLSGAWAASFRASASCTYFSCWTATQV